MVKTKRGGNGVVSFSKGLAKKTLRAKRGPKLLRFRREVEITQKAREDTTLANVVEIVELGLDATPPWYSMKEYRGDSSELLGQSRGNVQAAAELLFPVARTLKALSELPEPIYHRDLKPENLLYEICDSKPRLILSDFGCAFLKTDEQSRLTQEFRAVGAMAFRAPEYHYGRVKDVTEKGDIFSLGKLLWYFINGVERDVFPYTLWFPPEYDLARRFAGLPGIEPANLLIASAAHHDPARRISYDGFCTSLEELAGPQSSSGSGNGGGGLLRYEAEQALRRSRKRKVVTDLISVFMADVTAATASLAAEVGASALLRTLKNDCRLIYPPTTILDAVVDRESDSPLWNCSRPGLTIQSTIHYHGRSPLAGNSREYPHVDLYCASRNGQDQELKARLHWYFTDEEGLFQVGAGGKAAHSPRMVLDVLGSAMQHMIS